MTIEDTDDWVELVERAVRVLLDNGRSEGLVHHFRDQALHGDEQNAREWIHKMGVEIK